jgi:hypothetical protein
MKRIVVLTALGLSLAAPGFAAEAPDPEPDPVPPANRPNPEELRNRFRNFNPTEREARLRARLNSGRTNRGDVEKRREEWMKLSPSEREARRREFRERNLSSTSPRFNRLTPNERETKRTEIKSRVDNQIKELEARKATAPLTDVEQRRLDRFHQMSRRLEQGTALGFPQRPPGNRPARRETPAEPRP